MRCLRCGYCCIYYDVMILKPGLDFANLKTVKMDDIEYKGSNIPCPHLEQVDNVLRCKIHHFKIYKKTPCFDFTQIEQHSDCNCRMGDYILKKVF